MNYDEIEKLRKSGNLEEAYHHATIALSEARQLPEETNQLPMPEIALPGNENDEQVAEVQQETPLTISKRAMAWVLYDCMKQNTKKENYQTFYKYLQEYIGLKLGCHEKLITNQVLWLLGKVVFEYTKEPDFDVAEMEMLFDTSVQLDFSRQNKGYSMLFKAFHKALKESAKYIEFVEWWDFNNFIRDDYNHVKNDDGTKIMAIVEQAYTKYGKHLINVVEKATDETEKAKVQQKIKNFLPRVKDVCRRNKFYKKLPQYQVKLMIATDEFPKAFELLMNKAKERQTDFWVWEMIADAFDTEPEKKLACLCTAVTCRTNPRKLIKAREKMVQLFADMEMYHEAKTEIAHILRTCQFHKMEIPEIVTEWGDQAWYRQSKVKESNDDIYSKFTHIIEDIVFQDIPQRKVIVEFVNQPKQILNFIGTDFSKGYFKFGGELGSVKEGDVLLVRLKELDKEGRYELVNAKKTAERFVEGLLKDFAGEVFILPEKPFGFVSDLFIPPDTCKKFRLENGERISGLAMLTYNRKKEEWGWKVISID